MKYIKNVFRNKKSSSSILFRTFFLKNGLNDFIIDTPNNTPYIIYNYKKIYDNIFSNASY